MSGWKELSAGSKIDNAGDFSAATKSYLTFIEKEIGQKIDKVGFGVDRESFV
jgi:adenylosuccinate synthase